MSKYISILLLLLQSAASLYAQDTLKISKQTLLDQVLQHNLKLKLSEQEVLSARADYRQSNALFLPDVSVSHTAISTNNPLMSFGSKLNQELISASDFNPALLNDPNITENYATKIEVKQPLLNLDGIYARRAAKIRMQAMQMKEERMADFLKLESDKAYMTLQLLYQSLAVYQKALKAIENNLTLITDYYNQGLAKKTELLLMQVRQTQIINDYQKAQNDYRNASEYISYLINSNTVLIYIPEDVLPAAIETIIPDTNISQSRKDLQALQLSETSYHKMLQSEKMQLLPRINAFGSYELYDDEPLQADASGYLIGIQLTWNLFDGYKTSGKIQKAKAGFQKSVLENERYNSESRMEYHKTVRQLADAESKINLTKKSREQIQEAYRIYSDRFKQGLEKTSDLIQVETQVLQKDLEYTQSIYEYQIAASYLSFLNK